LRRHWISYVSGLPLVRKICGPIPQSIVPLPRELLENPIDIRFPAPFFDYDLRLRMQAAWGLVEIADRDGKPVGKHLLELKALYDKEKRKHPVRVAANRWKRALWRKLGPRTYTP
jgi:hypothetical protein